MRRSKWRPRTGTQRSICRDPCWIRWRPSLSLNSKERKWNA